MDYQKIVLQGYFNENSREYLESYFYREYKKAEKEFFKADEFFNGCLNVVKALDDHIKYMFNDRRNTLGLQRNQAKNGLLQYENMEGKTIEQKRKETIEFCEQELASLSENDFPIPLPQITQGRLSGNIYKKDLIQIKLAIENARKKCENKYLKERENETKLSDFFDLSKVNISLINKIQKAFKDYDGKHAGAVIYLLKESHEFIEIIPYDSNGKNFKNFYKLFGFAGTSEGARKYVSRKHWFDVKKNKLLPDETLSSIEKTLNEILKQK